MTDRPGKPSSRPPADLNDYNTPETPDKVSIDGSDQWGRGQVKFGYGSTLWGTADTAEQTGTRPSFIREGKLSHSDAQGYLGALRAKARVPNASEAAKSAYSNLISSLSSYRDTKIESDSSADSAWSAMLSDASDGRVNVMDLIQSGSSGPPGGSGSGGSSAYTGPVTTTSSTITDEITAQALLNNYARDLIGRDLNQGEVDKYVKRFNKMEANNPQVTLSVPGVGANSSVTNTAASKEELLRQVVSSNPDYAKFQIDTTVMDMLLADIEKGKKVING